MKKPNKAEELGTLAQQSWSRRRLLKTGAALAAAGALGAAGVGLGSQGAKASHEARRVTIKIANLAFETAPPTLPGYFNAVADIVEVDGRTATGSFQGWGVQLSADRFIGNELFVVESPEGGLIWVEGGGPGPRVIKKAAGVFPDLTGTQTLTFNPDGTATAEFVFFQI